MKNKLLLRQYMRNKKKSTDLDTDETYATPVKNSQKKRWQFNYLLSNPIINIENLYILYVMNFELTSE